MGETYSMYMVEDSRKQGFGEETWAKKTIWKTRRWWDGSIKMDL
jgi:hypothetical protein